MKARSAATRSTQKRRGTRIATGVFVDVAELRSLPPGAVTSVEIAGSAVTLVNDDGKVVALGEPCLRCGSQLAAASLRGGVLTCGRCGWQYDIHSGTVLGLPALRLRPHAVKIAEGRILVSTDAAR